MSRHGATQGFPQRPLLVWCALDAPPRRAPVISVARLSLISVAWLSVISVLSVAWISVISVAWLSVFPVAN